MKYLESICFWFLYGILTAVGLKPKLERDDRTVFVNMETVPIYPIHDFNYWISLRAFKLKYKGKDIVVDEKTVSNFASVRPHVIKGLVRSVKPRQCYPAVIHDGLVGEFGPKAALKYKLSWEDCANIFEDGLLYTKEPRCRRILLVAGVRFWGKIGFGKI